MKNTLFVIGLLIFVFRYSAISAEINRELVFKSDFSHNKELKGWYDVHKWLPQNKQKNSPAAKWYKVVSEKNEVFLRTSTMFGLSSLFKSPLKVDDSIIEIELRVKLRKPRQDAKIISIALTSRKCPSGNNGSAFWSGRQESGIIAQGYQHSIQYVNLIAWMKDGLRVHMSPIKPPFNLLAKVGKWVVWRLVYNHPVKQLRFYRSLNDKEPFIVQRNVDLSGVTLNSVWLGAFDTEYSQVEVYCTTDKNN